MAIEQVNDYLPGRDLNNLSINVDINRKSMDRSFMTVNYGTTPATVTVKVGSIMEVNGNMYKITGSDEVFQMSSTAHFYIGFDGTTFASIIDQGIWNPGNAGYYTSGNLVRTLRWRIDQTLDQEYIETMLESTYRSDGIYIQNDLVVNDAIINLDNISSTGVIYSDVSHRFKAYQATNQSGLSSSFTKRTFNVEEFDQKGDFDLATERFTAIKTGYYNISFASRWVSGGASGGGYTAFYKNGAIYGPTTGIGTEGKASGVAWTDTFSTNIFLNSTDYIEIYARFLVASTTIPYLEFTGYLI